MKTAKHSAAVEKVATANNKSQALVKQVAQIKHQDDSSTNAQSSTVVPHFCSDSVKMIGDTVGIANLGDEPSRVLAEDVTLMIKSIILDAKMYASRGRRKALSMEDIDCALRNKNLPPLFGYNDPVNLPFRFAAGGGRELFYLEPKEMEITEMVNEGTLAKIPLGVSLKAHWLCIDGIQPAIPDNPPPLDIDRQRADSTNPSRSLKLNQNGSTHNKFISLQPKQRVEVVKVKQFATAELSVEQQYYYKEITEACVGSDEARRSEALQSLTYDSGLHQMLPRLCTFISEGVKVNVVQNNLALLIYLMRMVRSLLDNTSLYLEKYLHELIPTVLTCIVSKQLCNRPEVDNHWALRDFGSRLLSQICRNFNTNTNNIQIRITQLLTRSIDEETVPLASLYGAISCLCEMGPEVQRAFLLKRLKTIGERLPATLEEKGLSSADRSAVEHIRSLVVKNLIPTIKVI